MDSGFLANAFAPVVLVVPSKDAEVACGVNHLSFTEMLAPFLTFNGSPCHPHSHAHVVHLPLPTARTTRSCGVLAFDLPTESWHTLITAPSPPSSSLLIYHTHCAVAKPQYPEPFALRMVMLKDLIRYQRIPHTRAAYSLSQGVRRSARLRACSKNI